MCARHMVYGCDVLFSNDFRIPSDLVRQHAPVESPAHKESNDPKRRDNDCNPLKQTSA